MTTTYAPIPSQTVTLLAHMGAIDVVSRYRAGTLPETMRRFVDLTIDQCELQGSGAQRWVDGVVALTLRGWARAQLVADADEEGRTMMIASCTLAGFQLQSQLVTSH